MTAAVFLVFSFSLFLDLLLRSHGIVSVLTPFCLFYYTAIFGWKIGLFLALITALPAAFFSGGSCPFELLTYPAVAGLSLWNLYRCGHGASEFGGHLISGAVIPILIFVPNALAASHETQLRFLIWLLPLCASSAILLPVFLFLLDLPAGKLALPLYADAIRKREGLSR